MTTNNLLPCPFCGSAPEMEPWHGGAPTKQLVACRSETCHVGPGVTGETPEEAISRWNSREAPSGAVGITETGDETGDTSVVTAYDGERGLLEAWNRPHYNPLSTREPHIRFLIQNEANTPIFHANYFQAEIIARKILAWAAKAK